MKNQLALITLGFFTTTAFAAMFPEDSEGEDIFQVEAQFLYANQSNNLYQAFGYDVDSNRASLVSTDYFNSIVAPDPEERWGFGGRLGYVFSSHKYDVQLRYFGINTTEAHDGVTTAPSFIVGPASYDNDQNFNFNSAELMFGRYFFPTEQLTVRMSYGIAFADIDQDSTTHSSFNSNTLSALINQTFQYANSFTGAGPKIMFDADYSFDGIYGFDESFSIVGGVGIGLLYGESENTNNTSITTHGLSGPITSEAPYNNSDDRVVPLFDAKLGFLFNDFIHDNFNIEAGYKLSAYLNAFDGQDVSQTFQNPVGKTPETIMYDQEKNYVYSGPYMNFALDFM